MKRYLILIIILLNAHSLWAQFPNPTYPRTACFRWGGVISDFARYDLVINGNNSDGWAQGIKYYNSDCIVLPTRDFNCSDAAGGYWDSQWYVRNADNQPVGCYCTMADPTYYCPVVGGMRFHDAAALYMSNIVDFDYFDGIHTDGLYTSNWCMVEIDINRDGVNDSREDINSAWYSGTRRIVQQMDNYMPANRVFVIQGNGFPDDYDCFNGFNFEYGANFVAEALTNPWYNGFGEYENFDSYCEEPRVNVIDGTGFWGGQNPDAWDDARANFHGMRKGLATTCLLNSGFYNYQTCGKDHYFTGYYDEFDMNLGYPTSSYHRVKGRSVNGITAYIYVRFFDYGCVVLNVSGATQSLSDADLSGLSGYDGPYYRFLGGQNQTENNGQQFTSVSLFGEYNTSNTRYDGDALFLLNYPDTVVCDIIIDDDWRLTSPNCSEITTSGSWPSAIDSANNNSYRSGSTLSWLGHHGTKYSAPGDGDYVIARPTITVPGTYAVYEWHGEFDDPLDANTIATNVPFEVDYYGGTDNGTIDQQANIGQWNLVGEYAFAAGTDGYIKITDNANGYVLADAFKFVYGGASGELPSVLPAPTGVGASDGTYDDRIIVTWSDDGGDSLYYQVYRNTSDSYASSSIVMTWAHTTSHTDYSALQNTTYFYWVRAAEDASGTNASAYSLSNSGYKELTTEITETAPGINFEARETADPAMDFYFANSDMDNVFDFSFDNYAFEYLNIRITADNEYYLYVNGTLIGSDDAWEEAEIYQLAYLDSFVVGILGYDTSDSGAIAVKIEAGNYTYRSDSTWKVTENEYTGWYNYDYDDSGWSYAHEIGELGVAYPWHAYGDVDGLPNNDGIMWIWTDDPLNDNIVFFRKKIVVGQSGETTPPDTSESEPDTTIHSGYYVAKTGSDSNDGSFGSPFLTIQHAADITVPGDSVWVRTGTYGQLRIYPAGGYGANGTSGNPIVYHTYNDEEVTIDGGASAALWLEAEYLEFDGFILTGPDSSGIWGGVGVFLCFEDSPAGSGTLTTNHVTIQNCELSYSMNQGILGQSDYCTFTNLEIHHNGHKWGTDQGIYLSGAYNEISYCSIHDNASTGIQMWNTDLDASDCPNNTVIENNEIYANGFTVIPEDPYYTEHEQYGHGIVLGSNDNTSEDNIIKNNFIYANFPNGIFLYSNSYNTRILNNTIVCNINGLNLDDDPQYVEFSNNLVYANNSTAMAAWIADNRPELVGEVNASRHGNGSSVTTIASTYLDYDTFDYNLYDPSFYIVWDDVPYSSFTTYKTASGNDANAVLDTVVFTDYDNNDFTLQAGSPGINQGQTIGEVDIDYFNTTRPQSTAYDIGAYEY